ncbi:MAG: hypothetical protein ACOH5I_04235 [Oligoflexus sp.]
MSDDQKSKQNQEELRYLLEDQQLLELLEKEWQENPGTNDLEKQRLQRNWQGIQHRLPKKRGLNNFHWAMGIAAAAAALFFLVLPQPVDYDPSVSPTYKSGDVDYQTADGLTLQWVGDGSGSIVVTSIENFNSDLYVILFLGDEKEGLLLWSGMAADLPQTITLDPSYQKLIHAKVCALIARTEGEKQSLIEITLENWQVFHSDNCIHRE